MNLSCPRKVCVLLGVLLLCRVLSSYVDPEYVKAQQRSSALPSVEPTTIATTGAITLLEELCGTKRLKTDAAAVGEEKKEEGEFKEEATQVDQQAGDASGQPTPTRIFPKREAVDGGTGVAESDFTWSSRVDADSIRLLLLACLCEPLSVSGNSCRLTYTVTSSDAARHCRCMMKL